MGDTEVVIEEKRVSFSSVVALGQGFLDFLRFLRQRKYLIVEMAKRDLSDQHIGSVFGVLWTFVHPIVMVFILWLVFSVGFKAAPAMGVPFVVWLMSGMGIWLTFGDVLSRSTTAVVSNPHLVKKLQFAVSVLPVVKLAGALVLHVVFLGVLILLILLYDLPVGLYWLQVVYYFFAMSVLLVGLSWITSSVHVFFRDTAQIVQIFLQVGFWGTPIFWDLSMMPENIRFFFKLNPMFYIVQGYRESFLYSIPFWDHWLLTAYYWLVALGIFGVGAWIFRQLRPHFADVV